MWGKMKERFRWEVTGFCTLQATQLAPMKFFSDWLASSESVKGLAGMTSFLFMVKLISYWLLMLWGQVIQKMGWTYYSMSLHEFLLWTCECLLCDCWYLFVLSPSTPTTPYVSWNGHVAHVALSHLCHCRWLSMANHEMPLHCTIRMHSISLYEKGCNATELITVSASLLFTVEIFGLHIGLPLNLLLFDLMFIRFILSLQISWTSFTQSKLCMLRRKRK